MKANAKPPSRLRATLWVVAGLAVGYGLNILLFRLLGMFELLLPLYESGWGVLFGFAQWLIMAAVGWAGFSLYQRSCRNSRSPSSASNAVSTEELSRAPAHPGATSAEPSPDTGRQPDPPAGKTVFISYRRDDSADVTGRIYDRLSNHFGSADVFKDVDSIPLGKDFREIIDDAVSKSSAVIVVIGRHWLTSESGEDGSRIHDENDFVRAEVSTALRQRKPVIPVLVANATMPMEAELPDDIKDITYRNGVRIRPDPDFGNDVERLIRGIEQT